MSDYGRNHFEREVLRRLVYGAFAALVAAVAVLVFVTRDAPALSPAGDSTGSMTVAGKSRTWLLHRPAGLGSGVPLVMVLHGSGSGKVPAIMERTQYSPKADAERFLAVYPNGDSGTGQDWCDRTASNTSCIATDQDVVFLAALIDRLVATEGVDPAKVFVVGHSAGGFMAYRMGCDRADKVTAIGPIGGGYKFGCTPSRRVPLISMQSTADGAGSISAVDRWRAFDACPAAAQTTVVGPVKKEVWAPCANGTQVVSYFVAGGSHTWFGGPGTSWPDAALDATAVQWDWFAGIIGAPTPPSPVTTTTSTTSTSTTVPPTTTTVAPTTSTTSTSTTTTVAPTTTTTSTTTTTTSTTTTLPVPPPPGGYLNPSSDLNGPAAPNPDRWTIHADGCEDFTYACLKAANVYLDGVGHLVLRIRREATTWLGRSPFSGGMFSGFTYGSGWPPRNIKSAVKVPFRIEVRAKMPPTPGAWAALWLVSVDRTQAQGVHELDIFEPRGSYPTQHGAHQHFWVSGRDVAVWDCWATISDATKNWHNYAAEVRTTGVVYRVDGKVCGTAPGVSGTFGLILSATLGAPGSWGAGGGQPAANDPGPWDMLVDWVHTTAL